jgi:hypothetical protein
MPTTTTTAATASDATAFQDFLAALSARDRANIEKHMAVLDADPSPSHARTWRTVALLLRRLAPMSANTIGPQLVQFFVADGKYRMQVFALEDRRDGTILLFMPDVLEKALKAGVLAKPPAGRAGEYPIRAHKNEVLPVEVLDAANTPDPQPAIKHMLGWNRKALRVTLPAIVNAPQLAAAQEMCELAAKAWLKKTPA